MAIIRLYSWIKSYNRKQWHNGAEIRLNCPSLCCTATKAVSLDVNRATFSFKRVTMESFPKHTMTRYNRLSCGWWIVIFSTQVAFISEYSNVHEPHDYSERNPTLRPRDTSAISASRRLLQGWSIQPEQACTLLAVVCHLAKRHNCLKTRGRGVIKQLTRFWHFAGTENRGILLQIPDHLHL